MSRLGSPQAGSRRVAIAKPKNDIYVALLGIALGAVIIACILLAMEMSDYAWTVNPKVSLAPMQVTPWDQAVALVCVSPIPDQGGSGSLCVDFVTG